MRRKMDDSEMAKLLLSGEAEGYRVNVDNVERDSHSTVIHAMERRKAMLTSTRSVEIVASVCSGWCKLR